jgi:hypothetical protein
MGIESLSVKRSRAFTRLAIIVASFLSANILAGCGEDDAPAAEAVFTIPRDGIEQEFFDLPWPTDIRRTPDGHIDVRDFPNPRGASSTLGGYLEVISTRLSGYSNNGHAYLRFSASVDTETLPAESAETVDEGASVFLLDLETGERHPATVTYQDEGTTYWPEHTIAVRPVWGLPLAATRRYAAVVTTDVKPAAGGEFLRSADLTDLVNGGGDGAVAAAREAYGDAFDVIEDAGVPRDAILSVAVFTTQDPTGELAEIRDWMVDSYDEPEAVDMAWQWIRNEPDEGDFYTRVAGAYYPSPNFQSGPAPYDVTGSGDIVVEDGVPVVAEEFSARFMLTVPTSPMPPDGYPIVLYAHGTGGDYASFVGSDVGILLAQSGYAVMGIDQVLHGDRNPTALSPEALFFNFLNPLAARNNNRQAALDVVQQARFAASVEIPERIIGAGGGSLRRFDPDRIYVYGHSQGGLNMPLFLAVDDSAKGGYLSGAGGLLSISIIDKKEPIAIAAAVQLFLALPGSTTATALEMEAFNYAHPVLSLLQTWIEVSDSVNYGRQIFAEPRDGFAPKSVFMTGGQEDVYTPANANAALAAATRVPLIEPVANRIEANDVTGLASVTAPITGNVAGGEATAGLQQYPMDGHFVGFTNEPLRQRIRSFFASFEDGVPTIPAVDMVIPPIDAGMEMDAGVDGGADAGADAGSDASMDVGTGDAMTDSSMDAGVPDGG